MTVTHSSEHDPMVLVDDLLDAYEAGRELAECVGRRSKCSVEMIVSQYSNFDCCPRFLGERLSRQVQAMIRRQLSALEVLGYVESESHEDEWMRTDKVFLPLSDRSRGKSTRKQRLTAEERAIIEQLMLDLFGWGPPPKGDVYAGVWLIEDWGYGGMYSCDFGLCAGARLLEPDFTRAYVLFQVEYYETIELGIATLARPGNLFDDLLDLLLVDKLNIYGYISTSY